MATITTEANESRREHGERKSTSKAERASYIEAYHQSGLTQKAFAKNEGIKFCTFTGWLRKRGQAGEPDERGPRAVRFAEVILPARTLGWKVEVQFCDGTMVRGTSGAEVASVAQALRSEKRC